MDLFNIGEIVYDTSSNQTVRIRRYVSPWEFEVNTMTNPQKVYEVSEAFIRDTRKGNRDEKIIESVIKKAFVNE